MAIISGFSGRRLRPSPSFIHFGLSNGFAIAHPCSSEIWKLRFRISSSLRAHSKMVLRLHGMEEVGVRFPVGPQFQYGGVAERFKATVFTRDCSLSMQSGGVRERLKRTVLKTVMPETASKVRILPPPLCIEEQSFLNKLPPPRKIGCG